MTKKEGEIYAKKCELIENLLSIDTSMYEIIELYIDRADKTRVVQAEKTILEHVEFSGTHVPVPIANIKQQAALEEFIEQLKNIY